MNLEGVLTAFDNPLLPQQENDPIPDIVVEDDDNLFLDMSKSTSQSTSQLTSEFASQYTELVSSSPAVRQGKRRSLASQLVYRNKKRRRDDNSTPFSKLVFSQEITTQIIELFLEEIQAGTIKDTKWSFIRLAIERIYKAIKAEYPRFLWSVKKIRNKLTNERRYYQQFLTLLTISNISYNPKSSLLKALENIQDSFLIKDLKAVQLYTIPIGNREIYAKVFYYKRATRRYIKQAIELIGYYYIPDDLDVITVDFSDLSDLSTEADLDDLDDNSNIDLGEVSIVLLLQILGQVPEQILERKSIGKHIGSRDSKFIAVTRGIKRLASSNQKLPGVDDIRAIVKDL